MFQCVYSIQCLDPEIKEFYIGSTDNFKKRIETHTTRYNSGANYKVYEFMKENGGMANWEINYIQKFKLLTKDELRVYEQWYLDTYKPELNVYRAYRTEDQKKENMKVYNKKYRKENKEYFINYQKEYFEKNKETLSIKQKEHREKNIEKIKKYDKEKYQKKKEKLKEKGNCPHCNLEMRKDCIKRHIKRKHTTISI